MQFLFQNMSRKYIDSYALNLLYHWRRYDLDCIVKLIT